MHSVSATADEILSTAIEAARAGTSSMAEVLNALPTPIYTTDCDGRVTFFNHACAAFAGRTPVLGQDRWCVTWKLFTDDGHYLPHEECPMAVAIRTKKPVRGVEAIAARPDGTRRRFRPYPTPLLDEAGKLVGAVNMLIDISSNAEQAVHLKAQAQRCRRLAKSVNDQMAMDTLELMAGEYEAKARELQLPN
jgi:PAS domain-containing protein